MWTICIFWGIPVLKTCSSSCSLEPRSPVFFRTTKQNWENSDRHFPLVRRNEYRRNRTIWIFLSKQEQNFFRWNIRCSCENVIEISLGIKILLPMGQQLHSRAASSSARRTAAYFLDKSQHWVRFRYDFFHGCCTRMDGPFLLKVIMLHVYNCEGWIIVQARFCNWDVCPHNFPVCRWNNMNSMGWWAA